jgi:predicted glycoside hydrolase/deacetylase ChbG (UPF0249 family)
MGGRRVIVNADDFGQSPGVNAGVAAAHEAGVLTSASLMVRWPAAEAAAAYAREHPRLGLGLHLDLGEWACVGGEWVPRYEVVRLDDERAVADEVEGQYAVFRRLVGCDPTHLDSHQHVHRHEPVRSVCRRLAGRLGVALRHETPTVAYCGGFYGQTADGRPHPDGITPDALAGLLRSLPPGVTELACHPGLGHDLDSMYRSERSAEVRALCDPRVRAAVAEAGIELVTFADVWGADR